MDLGGIEEALRAALRHALPDDVVVMLGPPLAGPATGLRAEVFVHAASFEDGGGVMPDGARVARRRARVEPDASGFAEERPARVVVAVTCVCASLRQSQQLAALVTPPLLIALETIPNPVLARLPDGRVSLRLGDLSATVHSCATSRVLDDAIASYHASLRVHLDGFLHMVVTQPGGLVRREPSGAPFMQVDFDPPGADLAREHVLLRNDTDRAIGLDRWTLEDGATRTHRFVFPDVSLAPGAALRVWTARGVNDAQNLYWGRTQAVWNNTGDTAILADVHGNEAARAAWAVQPLRRTEPSAPAPRRGIRGPATTGTPPTSAPGSRKAGKRR